MATPQERIHFNMAHFYDGQKGESRFDATPSQAKANGWLYSVSEMFKMLAKPGLEIWKDNELAKAAFAEPPYEGEDEKGFTRRIKAARYRNTGGAAKLGTAIHDGIETVLSGGTVEQVPEGLRKYVSVAATYFEEKGFVADALEKIVVCMEHGFAGTADCIGHSEGGTPFVLDWKSKKTVPGKTSQPYPENRWQLASYAVAHYGEDRVLNGEIWGCNAFVSTTEFGDDGLSRFEAFSHNPETMAEAWDTAKALFDLHRKVTGYDPRPQ
jgi:hypothetical protein